MNYSLITFGYRVGDLFSLMFIDPRHNDFEEMMLHHITTILLYVGYMWSNHYGIGTLISFLHDVSDIPVCFA